jgi:hypothetical protein
MTATVFRNTTSITAREAETPDASFDNGANPPGSNTPGIGINIGGGVLPAITAVAMSGYNWTEEDQGFKGPDGAADIAPAARTPQVSQHLGGSGFVDRTGGDWTSSGGQQGNGAALSPFQAISTLTNIANTAAGVPVTGEPTYVSTPEVVSLAAGWTETP